jgi:two-component system NtrC family response regulator
MQALEDRQVKHQNEYLKMELVRLREKMKILGRSREMEDIRRQILRIAPTGFTVTIYGESGTGKELIAQAIHDHGLGPERPFVAVDISALVSTLVESELFGHVKGAFTGATQNRPGYFTLANGGTLFLDEIGNMAWEVQGKLLRVLETRRVRPVGSELEHEINVRVIAATNRDLHSLVEQGRFREDLYYRLNVIPFRLPPLRERSEDIPVLAMHFLEKARTLTPARVEGFTTEAMARLMAYGWPGNVRELRNVVERLVATVDAPLLKVEHLPGELRPAPERVAVAGGGAAPKTLEELKEAKRKLKEQLSDKVEKDFVLAALDRAAWNVTRAAALVGMQRTNFHALMRKHDVKLPKTQ